MVGRLFRFLLGFGLFSGAFAVSFREGNFLLAPSLSVDIVKMKPKNSFITFVMLRIDRSCFCFWFQL